MKKIIALCFISVLVLSGCGKNSEGYDPQNYINYYTDSINEVNDEVLDDISSWIDELGLTPIKDTKVYSEVIETLGVALNELPQDQADELYASFQKDVDKTLKSDDAKDFLNKIDKVYDKETKAVEKLSDSGKEDTKKAVQKSLKNIYGDTVDDFQKAYDKNKDDLDGLAKEYSEEIQSAAKDYIDMTK